MVVSQEVFSNVNRILARCIKMGDSDISLLLNVCWYAIPQQTKNRHSESEIAPTEVSTTSSESSFFGIENDMLAVSTLGITTSSQHSERKRGCPHFGPNSEGGECPHSEQEGSPHSEWEGSPHLE